MTAITIQNKLNNKGGETMTKEKSNSNSSKQNPKRLKKYRLDNGYTIYSLAARLNVNFSTVSYWENGVKHPRHNKIVELEDLFKTNYRNLFTDLTEEEIAELEQRKDEPVE